MRQKKGSVFFVLDVFIATFIFIVTILVLLNFRVNSNETEGLDTKISGFSTILFKNTVSSYSNEYKDQLKQNTQYWPDPLITTDELIYYYYAKGYYEQAGNLTESLTEMLLPNYVGLQYSIDGTTIFIRGEEKKERANTVIANKKITYRLINTSYSLGPVTTEVLIWQ